MSPDDLGDVEARLRRAIQDRTNAVEPAPDGLTRIEEKLMEAPRSPRQRGWIIGLTSAAAAAAIVVAIFVAQDDDQPVDVANSTTTTSAPDQTSTTETTATTAPSPPPVNAAVTLWPDVDGSQRFDDPAAAARSFAVDLVGFEDPVVGAFRQGDSRSGEVPVQARANGPETTVLVRQMEDDTWYVIGAVTENITLDRPEPGATLPPSQFEVAGTALAFEGHVNVALYQDGSDEPLGEGFVTGSGSPPAGPYEGTIEWSAPDRQYGVLVLFTRSAEDGSVWEAMAIRVQLQS